MKPLGNDIYLDLLKMKDNKNEYGRLYKNGRKLSKQIFRIGGMAHGFKEGESYCNLIQYDNVKSSGNHCIINTDGEIVLSTDNILVYPYFLKGCVAVMNKVYYNLITKKPIVSGYHSINSKRYLFVENHCDKSYQTGVYKIEYATGNYEIFN